MGENLIENGDPEASVTAPAGTLSRESFVQQQDERVNAASGNVEMKSNLDKMIDSVLQPILEKQEERMNEFISKLTSRLDSGAKDSNDSCSKGSEAEGGIVM